MIKTFKPSIIFLNPPCATDELYCRYTLHSPPPFQKLGLKTSHETLDEIGRHLALENALETTAPLNYFAKVSQLTAAAYSK